MTRYITSHHYHGTRTWETLEQAMRYLRVMISTPRLYASESFAGTYYVDAVPVDTNRAWCVYASPTDRGKDDTGAWAWHIADVRKHR